MIHQIQLQLPVRLLQYNQSLIPNRARIREDLFDADYALPPPKFRTTSKLPQLQYGGLQVPALHCFATSSQPDHAVDLPHRFELLQATAKSLPSPAKFHHTMKTLQSTEDKETMGLDRAKFQLREIFHGIGFSSKLFCEIHNSAFLDQHIDRIADSLGTGGLLMYLQVWHHWACWCSCPFQRKHHYLWYWTTFMPQTT